MVGLLNGWNGISAQMQSNNKARTTILAPVVVKAKTIKEEKFGIKSSFSVMHFVDASVDQQEKFEIAQLIKFDTLESKITSVNLLINKERKGKGLFKIHFYRIVDNKPASAIVHKEIIISKAIHKGWLKFDLSNYNIRLKGDFIVGIEFLPSIQKDDDPIAYEIKLGGASKSFVRSGEDNEWKTPPHHFKLHVTALVNPGKSNNKLPDEDWESIPAFSLLSTSVNDYFSIFVKVPPEYKKNSDKKYPVVYLLDGNAYFDIIAQQKKQLNDKILVGIGYDNAYLMDSLRNRDYTFPVAEKQDSFSTSGGGEKFLSFITSELIPYIDGNYCTDTINRTIMGHSLGGYFSLFAFQHLTQNKNVFFNKFVSASPTLYYGNKFLQKDLVDHLRSINQKMKIVITYGENEFQTDSTLKQDFNSYLNELKLINNLEIETIIYPKYGHMDTAVPTFENLL